MVKRHMVTLLGALMMAAGLLAYAVVPVSASCAGLGVEFYDGSGHYFTLWSTGTCSNPTFGKGDLTQIAETTCIGNYLINQHNLSDCINQVKFVGVWPNNYEIDTRQDVGFGGNHDGGPIYHCEHNAWVTMIPDQMSSFIAQPTSLGCT